MKSFKVMCSLVVFCAVLLSVTAISTEKQVKDEIQDLPKKSSTDSILIADEKKSDDVEITTPKSVIIDALIKSNDSIATATVPTLVIETTTMEDDEDDDDYGQPEVDNGLLPRNCALTLCTG